MRMPEHSEAVGVILLIYTITVVLLVILWLEAGSPFMPEWLK